MLLLGLVPSVAFAQVTPVSPGPGDSRAQVDVFQAELEQDYAQALGNDCPVACRALESMRRAADGLCAVDPGDRCTRAKEKVQEATARVRASCPACVEELGGKAAATPAAPPETVAAEVAVRGRGGCGGCGTAPGSVSATEALAGGAAVLLALRRRRRR